MSSNTELRMSAYYYRFTPTGVRGIDLILNAIAWAGKAFHHTDAWTDNIKPYPDCQGNSCVDWIQNAAVNAAKEFEDHQAKLDWVMGEAVKFAEGRANRKGIQIFLNTPEVTAWRARQKEKAG